MEMKIQYRLRFSSFNSSDGWWNWKDLVLSGEESTLLISNILGIEFRQVPVKCQARSPFHLDGADVPCDRGAHEEDSAHWHDMNTGNELYTLSWK